VTGGVSRKAPLSLITRQGIFIGIFITMLSRLQEHQAEVRFFVQVFAQANQDNEEQGTRRE
jgi:hypothetical protein